MLKSLLLVVFPAFLYAQTLTFEDYLIIVKKNHPVAKVAGNLIAEAEANLMRAKGGFDPKLFADWQAKELDGKDYFNVLSAGLKVPTWFGADVKAQFDLANGQFLDPQNSTPSVGLGTVGVSVPLGQGLLIDARRAGIKQANIMRQANENERKIAVNELLYNASMAYWDWAMSKAIFDIYSQSVALADVRQKATYKSYLQGDRAAIDTLEAKLIWQDRMMLLKTADMELKNAALRASVFLWLEDGSPLEIAEASTPSGLADLPFSNLSLDEQDRLLAKVGESHPWILDYAFKLSSLDIERKLKADKMKPKASLDYNFLAKSFNYFNDYGYGSPLANNYKVGVSFSMPLFLRQERGDLSMTKLKIQNTTLQRDLKRLEVKTKLKQVINKVNTLSEQVALGKEMAQNWETLFKAETERFTIGESSLFLVNAREVKLLEAKEKLLSIMAKHQEERLDLLFLVVEL